MTFGRICRIAEAESLKRAFCLVVVPLVVAAPWSSANSRVTKVRNLQCGRCMGPRIPHLTVDRNEICWTSSAGAKSYDVVTGQLSSLRESGGDFSDVTMDCLVKNEQALCTPNLEDPLPGEAFWYLVRSAKVAASATYDSCCSTQVASRDESIADARGTCPPRHAHSDDWEDGQVTVFEPWSVAADEIE